MSASDVETPQSTAGDDGHADAFGIGTDGSARELLLAARAEAAAAHEAERPGIEVARMLSARVEQIVSREFERAAALHAVPGASVLALGGIGRRELSPFSDLDLLLLVPEDKREAGKELAQALFTPLWDAGFELGSAFRTHEEALNAAREDQTITTTLLDARFIAGDRGASRDLLSAFLQDLSGSRLEAYIDEKVKELDVRRKRFGGSVYLLEPNVKTGVGGLRDLAGALWISRARYRMAGISGIAHLGLLPRRDIEALRAARDTLLRIRCGLHLQAGRRDDRLTFDAQERLAKSLGYRNTLQALGVELLMRDYYLAAQVVEQTADALIDRCTREVRRSKGRREAVRVSPELELWDGRLTFRDTADLSANPALLVDVFVTAERESVPVLSVARDVVAQEAQRRAGALATNREVHGAFLRYLESPGATGVAIRGMYETGVLGALFPEFARLRARVQHDAYHVFTVDTHTVFALQKLLRLRAGKLAADEPVFTRMCQDLNRPLPLLIGLFFHDLGKGMGGDHSARGELLVRGYAERVELDPATARDAAFLVGEHLRLSHTAFRRDLSDPALIQDVAKLIETRERLDMLYLLTWADISSVGPETWNDWRSQLLAELYEKLRAALEDTSGEAAADRSDAAWAGARAMREQLADHAGAGGVERFLSVLPERYLATVSPVRARSHFDLWRRSRGMPVAAAALPLLHSEEAGELVVVADDRPGLLSLIAGAFAAHSIDILGAEIFSLKDGRALDSFVVQEPGGLPPGPERVARMQADLEKLLSGEDDPAALVARRRHSTVRPASVPPVVPKIRFDLQAARDATVVDVFARDRVGLLADLASAFHRAGVSITLARVATEGNRAADGFYLQDGDGSKITDPQRLADIERSLREALADDLTESGRA